MRADALIWQILKVVVVVVVQRPFCHVFKRVEWWCLFW
jgi:hypothetical protein